MLQLCVYFHCVYTSGCSLPNPFSFFFFFPPRLCLALAREECLFPCPRLLAPRSIGHAKRSLDVGSWQYAYHSFNFFTFHSSLFTLQSSLFLFTLSRLLTSPLFFVFSASFFPSFSSFCSSFSSSFLAELPCAASIPSPRRL